MVLPNISDATLLSPRPTASERYYVAIKLADKVNVTSTVNDGVFDTGDIMIHTSEMSFVAESRDMRVLD